MNFYGRMPMGFSGAVSLISCAHWSSANVYGSNMVSLWSFHHSRFYCLTCGEKRKGIGKEKGRREKGNRKGKEGRKKEYRKIGGKIRNFNKNSNKRINKRRQEEGIKKVKDGRKK